MSYYHYQNSSYYRPAFFGGFRFFPPVIKSLLIINTALFFLAEFFSLFHLGDTYLSEYIAYIFYLFPLYQGFQPWQLITYMFMHGNFMHLFLNMFALWMFGMELENNWGSKKFALFYFLCGLGAGISNLFIAPLFAPTGPTIGASGSVYGILLAFGLLYPNRPIFVFFILPIRARVFVLIYIALEIINGIGGTQDGIAHFAHLGGAAIGYIFILIDTKKFPAYEWFAQLLKSFTRLSYTRSYSSCDKLPKTSDFIFKDLHDEDYQKRIDEILDKISESGYQNLTEEEKRILFEASKKLN